MANWYLKAMNEEQIPAKKNRWRHIPNLLTSSRILLAAYFPFVPTSDQWIILGAALITEMFDGLIARTFNCTSSLGKVLDPIADKLLFLFVAFTWLAEERVSLLELILIGTRDIGLMVGVAILYFQTKTLKPIEAKFWSKLSTALQYFIFFIILIGHRPATSLLVLTFLVGIFASIQYFIILKDQERSEF